MSGISTTHEGFNLFVQGVQETCMRLGLDYGFEPVGIYSFFYVLWNDKKWFLAREVPFAPEATRDARIDPEHWSKLQRMMASELA